MFNIWCLKNIIYQLNKYIITLYNRFGYTYIYFLEYHNLRICWLNKPGTILKNVYVNA